MIYKVIDNGNVLEIEDMIFFHDQPQKFKEAFDSRKKNAVAKFDNCIILLLDTGRVIINMLQDGSK